ncbi:rRNA-processing protein fcf2 [Glycine soja]
MGVKYLEAVKRRLHATKQWSPDEIRKTWTKSEKIQIIYLHDGFYQVVFNSQEDYKFSLYEGPHRVVDHYLILQCWRPFFVMNVKKAKNVVVWLRAALDPKRHYKKGDSKSKTLPKYFQAIVDSPLDFFSGRLTKKKRKARLADEVLSDQNLAAYRKRKVREIEEQNRPAGNEKWKIKGSNSRRHKL